MNHAKDYLLDRIAHIVEITKDDTLSDSDKVKSVSSYARHLIESFHEDGDGPRRASW